MGIVQDEAGMEGRAQTMQGLINYVKDFGLHTKSNGNEGVTIKFAF